MADDIASLDLPEPLAAALAAWAEVERMPPRRLVERLLTEAVNERRTAARAALFDARRALEEATAMLTKLLDKGPGAVLVEEDFAEGEPGREQTARLLAADTEDHPPGAPSDARRRTGADLRAIRAALERAGEQYQAAADILAALDRMATASSTAATAPAWSHRPAAELTPEPQFRPLTRTPSGAGDTPSVGEPLPPDESALDTPQSTSEPASRAGYIERSPARKINRSLFRRRDNE